MEKYLKILKRNPFFEDMNDEEILSVLQCIEAKILKKSSGEYIFQAGETTNFMGLIVSGSAFILQEDLWGNRNIITKLVTGDFFAEPFAATKDSILNVSVLANEPSEIIMLNIQKLLATCPHACIHHSKLTKNMITVLAQKVLMLNNKITHISKRTTRDKILSYLSSESIRQHKQEFDIPYNRQQLADFLCVERSAMSAELSKLKKEGILDTNKNHFILKTTKIESSLLQ